MSAGAKARPQIELIIRDWLRVMTPEEREIEGARLAGFLAARLTFWVADKRQVAELFYALGDRVVILAPPAEGPQP